MMLDLLHACYLYMQLISCDMQLGTAYIALKPIGGLLQRPRTAVLVVLAFAGLIFFLKATLTAMLGTSDPLVLQ